MCEINSNNTQYVNENRGLVPYGEENPIGKITDETIKQLIDIYCNGKMSVNDKLKK